MIDVSREIIETDVLVVGGGIAGLMAALERKETRERHIRSDYPFTNPLLENKFLSIWKADGAVKTAWRETH